MVNLLRLKEIRELRPQAKLEDSAELDDYINKLTAFTDNFYEKSEDLRDALADEDIAMTEQCAYAIRDMLLDIGAEKLASGCTKTISEFSEMSAGSLEAYIENFLSSVSALSIDILMALNGAAGHSSRPPRSAGDDGDAAHILAVDDNAFFLNTLKSYLQNTHYKLTCVNSGSVALRFLEKFTPDLFILDIDMPDMDGYELAGKIRGNGFTAPIIFLTGNASKEYIARAVEAGAADFIVKPISKEQALEKIVRYV